MQPEATLIVRHFYSLQYSEAIPNTLRSRCLSNADKNQCNLFWSQDTSALGSIAHFTDNRSESRFEPKLGYRRTISRYIQRISGKSQANSDLSITTSERPERPHQPPLEYPGGLATSRCSLKASSLQCDLAAQPIARWQQLILIMSV